MEYFDIPKGEKHKSYICLEISCLEVTIFLFLFQNKIEHLICLFICFDNQLFGSEKFPNFLNKQIFFTKFLKHIDLFWG